MSVIKSRLTLVVCLLILSACATTASRQGRAIIESDGSDLASCKFLGTFAGTSGWGGLAQGAGMKNAQNEVRDDAADAGATHIVWATLAGGWAPNVSGKAYRCPITSQSETF